MDWKILRKSRRTVENEKHFEIHQFSICQRLKLDLLAGYRILEVHWNFTIM